MTANSFFGIIHPVRGLRYTLIDSNHASGNGASGFEIGYGVCWPSEHRHAELCVWQRPELQHRRR